jgi:hypothetical protein
MKKMLLISSLAFLMSLAAGLGADPVWKSDFTSLDGWYDNNTDQSFNAVIAMGTKEGTADVIQKGDGSWGKVAFVLENIDIDKFNSVRVNVVDIQKGAAYKLLAVNKDWSESYVVIDRGHGKGSAQGNIKDVTSWTGSKTFNLVVVIEGDKKKVTLGSIELLSKDDIQVSSGSKAVVDALNKKTDMK